MMNPGSEVWIGILGGGQLGRMLALEARRMGFRVLMWTGGDTSGAATLADLVLTDPFDSASAFDQFVGRAQVATVEFENIPSSLLEAVGEHLPLMPCTRAVSTCQHREREKRFLEENGIPCASFSVVDSAASLVDGLAALPGDAILKTAEFGYDGKGQLPISAGLPAAEIEQLWSEFDSPRAVLEEKIDLAAELSVIVVRGGDGNLVTFDPAENQHRHHILDVSIVPARLVDETLKRAREIAQNIAVALEYVGVLGVEFFLCTDGRLLVNEMAPRPHNSGHHTLDACASSQFEQQLRAISGMPLGSTRLIEPAVMWNVLGDLWSDPTTPPDWTPVLETPGAKLHLYGKDRASKGRKMGHLTFTAPTIDEALAQAQVCRRAFGYPDIT
ncbi:MAG: 5-(carboxyamino)imidazole ribonucleotide synthase [Verrucomicrobiales bacterium]